MKLIAEMNGPLDVALLPIGDNFTMGIDDAVKLNTEYATKAYESGVETVKKAAKKAVRPATWSR